MIQGGLYSLLFWKPSHHFLFYFWEEEEEDTVAGIIAEGVNESNKQIGFQHDV